jgi:hypothetical protein
MFLVGPGLVGAIRDPQLAVVVLRLGVLGLGLCGEDQLLSHLQPDQAEIYSDDIVIININPAVPGMLSI